MENRKSTDDKMSRGVWKEMENRKVDKARMVEARRMRRMKGKKEKEKREEFRRLITEEEIAIVRIVEEKEEDLIELRIVEEMVP